jgi:hypothetical protein
MEIRAQHKDSLAMKPKLNQPLRFAVMLGEAISHWHNPVFAMPDLYRRAMLCSRQDVIA